MLYWKIRTRVYELALLVVLALAILAQTGCSSIIGLSKDVGELATFIDNRHRYGTDNVDQYRTFGDHVNGTWRQRFNNLFKEGGK